MRITAPIPGRRLGAGPHRAGPPAGDDVRARARRARSCASPRCSTASPTRRRGGATPSTPSSSTPTDRRPHQHLLEGHAPAGEGGRRRSCTSPTCSCSTSRSPGSTRANARSLIDLFHRLGDDGRCVLVSSHVLDEVERFGVPRAGDRQGPAGGDRRLPGDPRPDGRPAAPHPHHAPTRRLRSPARCSPPASVMGVRLTGPDTVQVETSDVAHLRGARGPGGGRQRRAPAEVAPLDDDLDSVFRYLVGDDERTDFRRSSTSPPSSPRTSTGASALWPLFVLLLRNQVTKGRIAALGGLGILGIADRAAGHRQHRHRRHDRRHALREPLLPVAAHAGGVTRLRLGVAGGPRRRPITRLPLVAAGARWVIALAAWLATLVGVLPVRGGHECDHRARDRRRRRPADRHDLVLVARTRRLLRGCSRRLACASDEPRLGLRLPVDLGELHRPGRQRDRPPFDPVVCTLGAVRVHRGRVEVGRPRA